MGVWLPDRPFIYPIHVQDIVAVAVLMVHWLGGSGYGTAQHSPPGKTPVDILKERFARGEIDKDEFEERRRALGE